jgi:mono/diheme cytochrome c family protein
MARGGTRSTIPFFSREEVPQLVKPLMSMLFAAALAGSLVAGCSKSSDSSSSSSDATAAAATGPVSDAASDGLKDQPGAAVAAGDAAHGKEIFSQNCSSCHGADGTQGGVGPSLKGEKAKKDLAKTIAWIKNPQPPMPKLYPSPLGEKDVADVAAYVQSL